MAHARADELCNRTLEGENIVYFDYRDRGFRTLVQEEWLSLLSKMYERYLTSNNFIISRWRF